MKEAQRVLVLIGLMGAGKTSIGQKLAEYLDTDFVDADAEIVKAAGCSIPDIFEIYGETKFRHLEERVVQRLLLNGPMVLATGGGAYMSPFIRDSISKYGFSIWLKASLDVLLHRTAGRIDRPLLKSGNQREILSNLIEKRYPVYSEADLTIDTDFESIYETLDSIIIALDKHSINLMKSSTND